MIRKIRSISNVGVYPSFEWRRCARDDGNNELAFDEVNIIYGRNYSGKTTLSRVARALQTGVLSEKYPRAQYSVELVDGTCVTQQDPQAHTATVRVFNEDFVRTHLAFTVDPESDVVSFAVVGKENNEIEAQILQREGLLGSVAEECGLAHQVELKRAEWSGAKSRHATAVSAFQSKLTNKATGRQDGIKYHAVWGDPSYDRRKLERDVEHVLGADYVQLDEAQSAALERLLEERPRDVIPIPVAPTTDITQMAEEVKELVERTVSISQPIQELLEDAALAEWVRSGRAHHEGRRDTCGFCGGALPSELWDRLNAHFSKETEELRSEIAACRQRLSSEINAVERASLLDSSGMYAEFAVQTPRLQSAFKAAVEAYGQGCEELIRQLNRRAGDIVSPQEYEAVSFNPALVSQPYNAFCDLVRASNAMTSSLGAKQQDAKRELQLKDVWKFATAIGYRADAEKQEELATAAEEAHEAYQKVQHDLAAIEEEIQVLKDGLKDESGAATLANSLLGDYFGHEGLAFRPIGDEEGVRFEIARGDERAYHLSEGEKTLVAFCYFMAKLQDVETAGTLPVVWIDDPVSSLDGNHVFYLFSLIRTRLVPGDAVSQLVVSTHSLDFLKYLMELRGKNTRLFMLERNGAESRLIQMPKYLRNYVTEFNYLFHQVYRCAVATPTDDDVWEDASYSFGNNVRKFLEIYLYYRYPDGVDQRNCFYDKVSRFLGDDDVAMTSARRIANEYSHLTGTFERASVPMDVPEMQKIAQLVVDRIKESDPDQFESLLTSIGVEAVT